MSQVVQLCVTVRLL